MNSKKVTKRIMEDKQIYIVENHHEVLLPWAKYALEHNEAPVLITFDHHMDTRSAYNRYAMKIAGTEWKRERKRLLGKVDIGDEEALEKTLEQLSNDEHIDFALQTGILSEAVVFSLLGAGVCRDYGNSSIYYVDLLCAESNKEDAIDDKCRKEAYDKVIESDELRYKLSQVNQFIPGFFHESGIAKPFILDIDLDCFHTRRAIAPENPEIFECLIQQAEIITIATEGSYVELEKIEEEINEEYLLEKLLSLIEAAL